MGVGGTRSSERIIALRFRCCVDRPLGFFFSDFDLTFSGLNVNEHSRNLARTSSSAKMYGLMREANNPIKFAHSISQTLKRTLPLCYKQLFAKIATR